MAQRTVNAELILSGLRGFGITRIGIVIVGGG